MPSSVPTVDDLAADVVTHHYDDMIAPPGLTNLLGTVGLTHDLTAVRAVAFPPVAQGLATTGALFVDGRLFQSHGVPVSHAWRPDRVVRSAEFDGLRIESTTVCVPGEPVVAVDVRVRNLGAAPRVVALAFSVGARVTRQPGAWGDPEMPEAHNEAELDGSRILFRNGAGDGWSVQGLDEGTAQLSGVVGGAEEYEVGIGGMGRGGELAVRLEVPAGGESRVGYLQAVGSSRDAAVGAFDRVRADIPAAVVAAERFWNAQLAAMFDADGEEYAGRLPVLETDSPALRTLYWWGAFGVIWFRREYAGSLLGRSYDTLMPSYWATATFIWDYSLSSLVHALLDPVEMKRQLRHWIASDIHRHFGTSALTGQPLGRWYSVNDYAMTRLVTDYVRVTGDEAFLDERIATGDGEPRPVADHLVEWAEAWRGLRGAGPLADYGEIDNLLECVSSYTHEVASLNAANVWCLRTVAAIRERRGDAETAARLRAEADELALAVRGLYLDGEGYFAAGQPDGSRLPVRHCYDFNVVGTAMGEDLPAAMREEMVAFFRRELQTENWMRALSPWDPDASYSVRPDHQWNGAYPAWPADAGRALVALGAPEVLLDWLDGLARSANQGPPGQAHFVEEAIAGIGGGARKAPPQLPYINDWACSSAGAWAQLVIEGVFGVRAEPGRPPRASGLAARLDPGAVLRGLIVEGRRYDVHADGRVEPAS